MRPSEALRLRRDALVELVNSRGASRLRVFGSVARGQDHDGSDVDLLVDMPIGASLLQLVGLQLELQDALGAHVDLCTERELHPMLRDRILAEARAV
jgi:predicted nucleotidyltransferase